MEVGIEAANGILNPGLDDVEPVVAEKIEPKRGKKGKAKAKAANVCLDTKGQEDPGRLRSPRSCRADPEDLSPIPCLGEKGEGQGACPSPSGLGPPPSPEPGGIRFKSITRFASNRRNC